MSDDANNDPIGKALNLTPITYANTVKNIIAEAHDDSARADFETARSNIQDMIQTTQEAIGELAEIAKSSQHPRAFEVLAKLIDTGVAASKNLLDLQTKIREINNVETPMSEQAKTINNNLFVGSTTEFQKAIKNMMGGKDEQS